MFERLTVIQYWGAMPLNMTRLPKIEIEDFWLAIVVGGILALPLTVVLIFNGIGYLPSFVVGLSVGLFAALAVLSEEYKFLRVICALIGITMAVLICQHVNFSMPITILGAGLGALLGYFSRKWINILSYIT